MSQDGTNKHETAPKMLFELGPFGRECRFPVGEHRHLIGGFLFCAAPTQGASYCDKHARLCGVRKDGARHG